MPACKGYEPLSSDPDIAGPGTLTSFCLACILTMVLAWPFFAKLPWEEYMRSRFDGFLWRAAKRRGWCLDANWDEKLQDDEDRHRQLILTLSDTQFLASIAMMIGTATKDDISVYHTAIVTTLVWLSSGTHTTALIYAATNLVRYPAIRTARFLALLAMVALLTFLVTVQGNRDIYENPGTPVRCFLPVKPTDIGGPNARWMAVYLVLILLNTTNATLAFFPSLNQHISQALERFDRALRHLMIGLVLSPLRNISPDSRRRNGRIGSLIRLLSDTILCILLWLPLLILLWILRSTLLLIHELFSGMIASCLTDIVWFTLGIWDIVQLKAWARENMEDEEYQKELDWGFGQLVALLLVFAPLWAMWLTRKRAYHSNCAQLRSN